MNNMRELDINELETVNGGVVFIPIVVAFGKGVLQGTAVAGAALITLDALGIIEL